MNFHKAGQIKEADHIYTAILKVNPKQPDANHNMGVLAVGLGKINESIPFFEIALEVNPNITQFWISYIEALIKLNQFVKAKLMLEKAKTHKLDRKTCKTLQQLLENSSNLNNKGMLQKNQEPSTEQVQTLLELYNNRRFQQVLNKISQLLKHYPDSIALHDIYAGANAKLRNFDKAITSYKEALLIKPNYAEAYYNIGVVLQDQGKLDEAIKSLGKAIKLNPNFVAAYNNIGNVLKEKGLLNQAIESYNNALSIKPNFIEAFINLNRIEVQLSRHNSISKFKHNNLIKSLSEKLSKSPKYQVNQSILKFIQGNFNQSISHSQKYDRLTKTRYFEGLNDQDKVFCNAYMNFIKKLINVMPTVKITPDNKIFHVGESHCLSYAHNILSVEKQKMQIFPTITFGAKAYHFSKNGENAFKEITKRNLDAFPKKSYVFISFGEIDCRSNEGLNKIIIRDKLNLTDLVNNTVRGYVNWFKNVNKKNNHRYYFFNLPAPVYQKEETKIENQECASRIALFNETLKAVVRKNNFFLIDVYKHTQKEDGFSNELHHCDNRHLKNTILPIIEKQLNESLKLA